MALENEYRYLIQRAVRGNDYSLAYRLAKWSKTRHGFELMCEIPGIRAGSMTSESDTAPQTTRS